MAREVGSVLFRGGNGRSGRLTGRALPGPGLRVGHLPVDRACIGVVGRMYGMMSASPWGRLPGSRVAGGLFKKGCMFRPRRYAGVGTSFGAVQTPARRTSLYARKL